MFRPQKQAISKAGIALSALLILLGMAWPKAPEGRGALAVDGPHLFAGAATDTVVHVERTVQPADLNEFLADSALAFLAGEVSDFCESHTAPYDPQELEQSLESGHDDVTVLAMQPKPKYHYITDEDGVVRRVCTARCKIEVDDEGESSTFMVTIVETVDV